MSRPCGAHSRSGRKRGPGWRWLVTEVAEGSFAGRRSSMGLISDVPRDPGPGIGLSPHSALDTWAFFLGPSGSDLPAREHGEASGAAPLASKICELKSGCRRCWGLRSRGAVRVGAIHKPPWGQLRRAPPSSPCPACVPVCLLPAAPPAAATLQVEAEPAHLPHAQSSGWGESGVLGQHLPLITPAARLRRGARAGAQSSQASCGLRAELCHQPGRAGARPSPLPPSPLGIPGSLCLRFLPG